MCDINVFGKTFGSAEHANQWKKAMKEGKEMLTEDIRNAVYAGKVKQLSKAIPVDTTAECESQSLSKMHDIIDAKAAQVPEFKQRLLDTEGSYLAEAGLWLEKTEKIDSNYFPGQKRLGILLMDIRDSLSSNPTKTPAYFGTPSDDSVISMQIKQGLDATHSLTEPEGDLSTSVSSELIEGQQLVRPKLIPHKKCDEAGINQFTVSHGQCQPAWQTEARKSTSSKTWNGYKY